MPELRAAGIFAATAPYVALIEDHCDVPRGLGARIARARTKRVTRSSAGSIRNSRYRRVRDWAAFFCEYSRFMEPAPAGAVEDLPG